MRLMHLVLTVVFISIFRIQGGDFSEVLLENRNFDISNIPPANGDGTGGKSIYGDKFADENLWVLLLLFFTKVYLKS